MKSLIKTLFVSSLTIAVNAYALLPNPTSAVPNTSTYSNITNAGTIAVSSASTPLTVIQTTPPPLLTQSSNQTIIPTNNGLAGVVYAFVVRNGAMGEELIPIQQGVAIKAGDILEYQGYFTNYSNERIRKTTVTMDIPKGVELVGNILPLGATATINGSTFSRVPLRGNMGGTIQEIPFKYYKALRWTVEDVGLGGTAIVKYRATLK